MLCVAAGNNPAADNDAESVYPASCDLPNIIAVAARDYSDALADFSHWGATTADLAAPGVAILSTVPYRTAYEENFDGDILEWVQTGWPQWWGTEFWNLYYGNVLSDSIGGLSYPNNANTLAFTIVPLDVSNALGVQISFDAMYPLENEHDFVQLELATEGQDFTAYNLYLEPPYRGGLLDSSPYAALTGQSLLLGTAGLFHLPRSISTTTARHKYILASICIQTP